MEPRRFFRMPPLRIGKLARSKDGGKIMNIERYKWPVIVAASLHGALFFSTPDKLNGFTKPSKPEAPYLKPIPTDIIEVAPPDIDARAEGLPAKGGPANAELPDIVALPDATRFTMPPVDHVITERITTTIDPFNGHDGNEIGSPNIGNPFVSARSLDRQPRATAQISPDYPSSMRQQGIIGSVTVEFDVNTEGKVVRADVVHSTRREFEEPALRAVRNWRFEPGKRHGRAVPFRMTVPIEFGLGAD